MPVDSGRNYGPCTKAPARVPFLLNYSSGEGTHSGGSPPPFLLSVGYSSSSSTAGRPSRAVPASGKSSGVASRSDVHSVAPYSFRSATDESVQAMGFWPYRFAFRPR